MADQIDNASPDQGAGSQTQQQPQAQPQQPTGQPGPQPQQPFAGQPGYQAGVPPYGAPPQTPGYQPPQGAPVYYAQPQPGPLMQLTGGMKFGWFAVGFLIGIAGPLLAWLLNVDKVQQVKSDALKWSIIGAVVGICLNMISFTFLFGSVAALSGIGASGSSFSW